MRGKDIFGRRMAAMMAAVLLFTSVDIPTVATEGEEITYSSDAAGDSASASPTEDAEQEIVLDEDTSGDGEPVQPDDQSSQTVESTDGITIDAVSVVEPETEDAETAEKAFDAMSVTAADLKDGREYLFYTVIDGKVYLLAHHDGEVITVRTDASVLGSDTAAGSRFGILSTLDCEKYDPQSGTYESISLESGEITWGIRKSDGVYLAEAASGKTLYIGKDTLGLSEDATVMAVTGTEAAKIQITDASDVNGLKLEKGHYISSTEHSELRLAMVLADGENYRLVETETGSETEAETETGSETEAVAETESGSEAETSAETEMESESETAAETEVESESETAAETEMESESETAAEIETESETETESELESESETESEMESESETESEVSDDTADVETAEDWESTLPASLGDWRQDLVAVAQSQIGYAESTENYRLTEDGEKLGYTRYGAWYGNPYGKWDAMFASFCIHYAGSTDTEIPLSDDTTAWQTALEEAGMYRDATYQPQAGDLVFLAGDEAEDISDQVAVISATESDEDGNVTALDLIQGDYADKVEARVCEITDPSITGYAQIAPDTQDEDEVLTVGQQIVETQNYIVTVTYDEAAQIPEDAELRVTEYGSDTAEYQNLCEKTGETYDWLLDISFYQGDQEIEPMSAIQISVKMKDASVTMDEDSEVKITHFAEDGTEVKEGDDLQVSDDDAGRSEVSFEVNSLSLVAGKTYHPATVTNQDGFVYGNYYLIYKVEGSSVYFLANYNSAPVTFVVPLSSFVQKGNGDVTSTYLSTLNDTFYYTGSIVTGTVNNATVTLNWDDLLWYHNGNYGTIRNKNITESYLNIGKGSLTYNSWQDLYKAAGSNTNYTRLYQILQEQKTGYYWGLPWLPYTYYEDVNYYLSFVNNKFTGGSDATKADFTIAKIGTDYTPGDDSGGDTPSSGVLNAVYTGTVTKLPIGFYSVTADASNQIKGLAGVKYTIYKKNPDGSKGAVAGKLLTTDDMRIDFSLLSLAAGDYIMEMTEVPDGYVRNSDTWTFTLTGNDNSLSLRNTTTNETEGIILINPESNLDMDKTGSVVDYANRTYQVDLSAKSNLKQLQVEGLQVHFVVDQSNSMLFPSGLKASSEYGAVIIGSDGTITINTENLRKDKVYYFVADAKESSTVYAVYYYSYNNGKGTSWEGWYYQDASYYAKATYLTETDKILNTDLYYRNAGQKKQTNYIGEYEETNSQKSTTTYHINGGQFGYKAFTLQSDKTSYSSGAKAIYNTKGTTCTLYEAVDEYNRLHYLEQSLSEMVQMLGEINPSATVTLDTFTKSVVCKGSYTLNSSSNISNLLNQIGNITTDGGTRQDLALEHVATHCGSATNDYVILITDGAPVLSGKNHGVSAGVGTFPATGVSANSSGTVYERIVYQADVVKSLATLSTVGLGMKDVESGSNCLKTIATDGEAGKWWFQPENSSELTKILCDQILNQIVVVKKTEVYDYETVTDYISDTFYPIDPDTEEPLTSGTKIDKNGNVRSGITTAYRAKGKETWYDATVYNNRYFYYNSNKEIYNKNDSEIVKAEGYWSGNTFNQVGTVLQDDNGSWYVQWENADMDVDNMSTGTGWTGRIYLKAKEDFIGGNAIATNKSATVTMHDGNAYSLETPTVNVRLLGMTKLETDVTVYKGDTINGETCTTDSGVSLATPLDSLKYFYDSIRFQKLVNQSLDGSGDGTALPVYNKKGATVASGCEASTFSLSYAAGTLSADAWKQLLTQEKRDGEGVVDSDGDPVYSAYVVPYKYSDADGTVGYFTFQLKKKGTTASQTQPDGSSKTVAQTADFESHTANVAKGTKNSDGSNWIEQYTLTVTYTAYRLGEYGRASQNVHNGSNGPGTEVGSVGSGDVVNATTNGSENDSTEQNKLIRGYGTLKSENIHSVYAIQGKIQIWKTLTSASSKDQTFTFELYRADTDGNPTGDALATETITVPAGSTGYSDSASAGENANYMAEFAGLERGEYIVKEVKTGKYNLKNLAVTQQKTSAADTIGEAYTGTIETNCQYKITGSGNDQMIHFTMGNKDEGRTGENVIGKSSGAMYTSYTGKPKGVIGQALFTNEAVQYRLPGTGGWGIRFYTFGGWLLLALCLMGGIRIRLRHEGGGEKINHTL